MRSGLMRRQLTSGGHTSAACGSIGVETESRKAHEELRLTSHPYVATKARNMCAYVHTSAAGDCWSVLASQHLDAHRR